MALRIHLFLVSIRKFEMLLKKPKRFSGNCFPTLVIAILRVFVCAWLAPYVDSITTVHIHNVSCRCCLVPPSFSPFSSDSWLWIIAFSFAIEVKQFYSIRPRSAEHCNIRLFPNLKCISYRLYRRLRVLLHSALLMIDQAYNFLILPEAKC